MGVFILAEIQSDKTKYSKNVKCRDQLSTNFMSDDLIYMMYNNV